MFDIPYSIYLRIIIIIIIKLFLIYIYILYYIIGGWIETYCTLGG